MPTHTHRFSLDSSSRKFRCEGCGKKRLVRYKDNQRNAYLPEIVGKCDRIEKCKYHLTPKQFFKDNPDYLQQIGNNWRKSDAWKSTYQAPTPQARPIDFIPEKYLQGSMKYYGQNHFVQYLRSLFHDDLTDRLIQHFHIGTSKRWKGSTVFWQIDHKGNIRHAKVMLYRNTGNRTDKISFPFKSILKKQGIQDPNLQQCFFGEHQLATAAPDQIINIVESEKTVILMSVLQAQYIWLATGGKSGCKWYTPEVAHVLTGRKVILYPDLGAYEAWSEKAQALRAYARSVHVSKLLEDKATLQDKEEGFDLADYLIRRDDRAGWALRKGGYPLFWDG